MLDSLSESLPSGLKYEVLLADDASTDETPQWLESLDTAVAKTFRNEINTGYAATNNIAVRHAGCEVLALLNNDLLLSKGWLEPMLLALMQPALRAGVVGNLQRKHPGGDLDHAGFQMTLSGHLSHVQQWPASDRPWTKTLAVTGACMLLRRSDYLDCGGFDEIFKNGGEDVDLCFKLQERGLHSYVVSNSCVMHHVSLSRGSAPSLNNERNSRLLFRKWRKRLKFELADRWFHAIAAGGPFPSPLESWVDTELLATPCLASLRVAEAILCQHEKRWETILGTESST